MIVPSQGMINSSELAKLPEDTDEPDERVRGYCDCCDEYRALERCWPQGIETFACDECRGCNQ